MATGIILAQQIMITLLTQVAGENCYTRLPYNSGDTEVYHDPADVLEDWLDLFVVLWKDIMPANTYIVAAQAESNRPPGVPLYLPSIQTIGEEGTVASDSLPPFVSYRFYKQFNNEDIDPPTATRPFKMGMLRPPGVPEAFQEAGVLNGAAISAITPLTSTLHNFATVDSHIYTLSLAHPDPTGTSAGGATLYSGVMVTGLVPSIYLGTQNSRKPSFF